MSEKFGIKGDQTNSRVKSILQKSQNTCLEKDKIFEKALAKFFQSLQCSEIKMMSVFHANKMMLPSPNQHEFRSPKVEIEAPEE